jgi:hypothetical protein
VTGKASSHGLPLPFDLILAGGFMETPVEVSVHYRKIAMNLLAIAFMVIGMAIALYMGAFP